MASLCEGDNEAPGSLKAINTTVLCRMFPGHIISRRGDIPWPSRSPDLTVCDYFLWSYLKSKVYVSRPQTTDDLKIAIVQEIANIDGGMLERATRNFRKKT
ncbi:hypothetical protein ANN_03583 [Periplaneta americana]|uniref:Per a allergen n=1 Tax=Periplaneta americana TaxID=6978 RepID=A0ABQ8TZD5_PERAM|nr:hypothetical protein ANN_03583 [Periplaneta americana]